MKAAFFHNLPSGGALRALYDKIAALEAAGVQVSLYSLGFAESDFLPSPKISGEFHAESFAHAESFNLKVYIEASQRLAERINSRAYDVIYVDKCRYVGSPSILRFLKGVAVFYCHEPLGLAEYSARWRANAKRLSLGKLLAKLRGLKKRDEIKNEDRRNLAAAPHLWTCSEFAGDWINRIYNRRAAVVYQGVNSQFFCPDPGVSKEKFVLSVGRIEPRKGFYFLAEVLAQIPQPQRPLLKIVYDAAEAAEKQRITRFAEERNLRIEWIYRPEQTELRSLYRRAAVLWCGGYEEPFGLTVLEAMACGTAAMAVDEGGYRESVLKGKTGLLLKRDAGLWAQEWQGLQKNLAHIRGWEAAAIQSAQARWTWQPFVDKLKRLAPLTEIAQRS